MYRSSMSSDTDMIADTTIMDMRTDYCYAFPDKSSSIGRNGLCIMEYSIFSYCHMGDSSGSVYDSPTSYDRMSYDFGS